MGDRQGESIGARVRRLRLERELSLRDIAAPGVSASYVSRIESDDRRPSVTAIRKLARNLGVSAIYLETGREVAGDEIRDMALTEAELALRLGDDQAGAEKRVRQLLKEAVEAGDIRAGTRARLVLGLMTAGRGEHDEAIARLERVVEEPWVTPLTHPDAFVTLGHSYTAAGEPKECIKLFRRILKDLARRQPINATAIVRFSTYLSFVLVDVGDLDGARVALSRALRHAAEIPDDPYTKVRLYWSSARLASNLGDYPTAQDQINQAIMLLRETEDQTHLARAHLLAAEISIWDDDLPRADDHLTAAAAILPTGATTEDKAYLAVQQAFVLARRGAGAIAVDAARAAVELLGDDEDATIRGRAQWALAEALAGVDEQEASQLAFTRAAELIPPESKHSARFLTAWQQHTDRPRVRDRS